VNQTATEDTSVRRPLSRDALFKRVGLLVGLSMMGLLYLTRPDLGDFEVSLVVQAAVLTAITVIATVFVPWHRLAGSIRATPPLALLVVAFLTREAAADGAYAQLVLLPVVWLAVYGTPRELLGGLAGVTVALVAPMMIPGGEGADWRRTVFLIATAGVLGFAVQLLFAYIRSPASPLGRMTRTDVLTGTADRRAWDHELHDALADSKRTRRPMCVAVLDVDHLKGFNDQYGRQAGDRLLKELAARWQTELRRTDVLARIGGDEFGLILPGCTPQAALRTVIRFCHGLPYGLTCSAGIAAWNGMEAPDELHLRASAALDEAKQKGGGRPVMAEPGQAPPRRGSARPDRASR
jgi:diguanylate cyclase (GGDEF)-like protein